MEKRHYSDIPMTEDDLANYKDQARKLSTYQCDNSIEYNLRKIQTAEGEDLKERLVDLQWWIDRQLFFDQQDDIYHLTRHYENTVYQLDGVWYMENDKRWGHW